MSWVLRGLQDEKSGENDQFISLYRYFIQAESYRDEMQALSDAAFYTYQDTGIGKAAARALYSPILRGSVTRMELYASCAYAHFLSYGLELSERQMYEIAPSDIGNLFHAAIDMYFTRNERGKIACFPAFRRKTARKWWRSVWRRSRRNTAMRFWGARTGTSIWNGRYTGSRIGRSGH